MLKKITTVILLLLLLWFTLFVTGLSIGDTIFTIRDFDVITVVWWVLFLICVGLYFRKPKIGVTVGIIFEFIWIVMQALNFLGPPTGIAKYNAFFEDTHHILPPSNTTLVPDTAHLILFVLLLLSFCCFLATAITQSYE